MTSEQTAEPFGPEYLWETAMDIANKTGSVEISRYLLREMWDDREDLRRKSTDLKVTGGHKVRWSLRTSIANTIAAYDEGEGTGYPMQRYEEGADVILGAVRKAVLSDRAVEAAVRADISIDPRDPITVKEGKRYQGIIAAALDAVVGGDHD